MASGAPPALRVDRSRAAAPCDVPTRPGGCRPGSRPRAPARLGQGPRPVPPVSLGLCGRWPHSATGAGRRCRAAARAPPRPYASDPAAAHRRRGAARRPARSVARTRPSRPGRRSAGAQDLGGSVSPIARQTPRASRRRCGRRRRQAASARGPAPWTRGRSTRRSSAALVAVSAQASGVGRRSPSRSPPPGALAGAHRGSGLAICWLPYRGRSRKHLVARLAPRRSAAGCVGEAVRAWPGRSRPPIVPRSVAALDGEGARDTELRRSSAWSAQAEQA